MEKFTLSNGVEIPAVGYGTYLTSEKDDGTVAAALAAGYRHFDTASFYGTEQALGDALKASGVPREELFLTSKLWKDEMGYENALAAFERSLQKLGTDYLDLYLIHWPRPDDLTAEWRQLDRDTWRALEDLYRAGRVRAIGVSNFLPHHLRSLMKTAEVMPMVNQIEFHPGYPQTYTVEFCKAHGILPEAWSPLGRTRVLQDERLAGIAAKYGKSVAQLCVRFALQCGVAPLPKSSSPARMQANLDVFDFVISDEDMDRILTLPQFGWSGLHPDYPRETV
ncbi:MAG TPA: aldo/keto reductase [Candidatus Agathobaculum pullistercoris]|nr:aldo/keto reductase [uncultured Agathobaculum sp.]HIX11036.1 aldo/keto reductase [Candidatus Agathobaculum pullistercoris]